MIAAELKQHFQKPYHFDNWKGIFRPLFRQLDLLATPQHLFENIESVKKGFQFGTAILDDGKKLALFEVEVSDNVKIANNRVALRNIASQYIDQFITHGALVLYYSKKQKDYRFTFIAKQSEFDEEGTLLKTETNPKRFTYVLGENETCSTAARQFDILFKKNGFLVIKDFIEAFSVEKLSKDFFKDYRNKHYSGFITYLTGENADGKIINPPHESLERVFDNNQKAARDFVKKLLGRFVFMQFLQKKRWLGCPKHLSDWIEGDLSFMQNLFKNYPNKDFFHSKCLTELFHNTLNNDREETNYLFPLTDSRVPYLNGGLFDRENLATHTIDFPPQYFGDLLDFFDQYNFTIDENDPEEQEVGIDPEMLGHIFENLLEDNKDKGAFYTPKEIVQYMCQESLIQYLKTHLNTEEVGKDDIEQFVRHRKVSTAIGDKDKAQKVNHLLKDVKICDPAIGSGAFPIGLLQEIYKARLHIYPFLKPTVDFSPAKVKKEIIQNSIYGVDKDGGAVDIARLRFWLALIVDEDKPEPLPNLDYKIMQGDSLLESFEGIPLDKIGQPKETQVSVKIVNPQIDIFGNIQNGQTVFFTHDTEGIDFQQMLDDYFEATSQKKIELHKRIDTFVLDNIHYNLEIHSDNLKIRLATAQKRLDDKLKAFNNEDQRQKLLESKEAIEVEKLKVDFIAVDAKFDSLKALQESPERPFFLWQTYFKDVFDTEGFDIVIGNPPYVAIQRMKLSDKEALQKSNYETFESTGDLYALFYEQGQRLLKKNGVLAYITSRQWLNAGYGKSLRHFFVNQTSPLKLIDFGQNKLFDGATVFVNILIFSKNRAKQHLEACLIPTDYKLRENRLDSYFEEKYQIISHLDENTWKISDSKNLNQIIESKGVALKDIPEIQFYAGIKTGLNDAFHITEDVRSYLIDKDIKNADIIKPLLRGKDIKRYGYEFEKYYILFIPWHFPLQNDNTITNNSEVAEEAFKNEFPYIYSHLEQYKSDLSNRNQTETGIRYEWYALQRFGAGFWQYYDVPKIVWIEISDRANYAYDDKGMYLTNSAYFLVCEEKVFLTKYVLAILNSKVSDYYFSQHTAKIAGGRMRYTGQYVGLVRIPEVSKNMQKCFETVVNYILFLKSEQLMDGHERMMSYFFEHIIDLAVYELFFPEQMYKAGFEIMKYIKNLENKPMLTYIKTIYEEFNDSQHPIRNAVSLVKSHEPFSTIEETLNRK